ncbi:hypothetical protein IKQ74_00915 [Candidatus Saccharibacteria bacterium]|jgi:hypothetical protein|nr:hypothetical protein [Candidatus Saccharibacteria bacterium]
MSSVKDVVKEAGAILTIAALTVATNSVRVFADGGTAGGGDSGSGGSGATANARNGVNNVNPGAETDLNKMLSLIFNIIFGIVGVVAVAFIIVGGINYIVSQGDAAKVQKAKSTILYGVIGLVVVLLAFAIVGFVLNGLMGQ